MILDLMILIVPAQVIIQASKSRKKIGPPIYTPNGACTLTIYTHAAVDPIICNSIRIRQLFRLS